MPTMPTSVRSAESRVLPPSMAYLRRPKRLSSMRKRLMKSR
jgi:hypothetical protein